MHEIVDAELFELKHNGAQIRSQYFGIRVLLHFVLEGFLRVQTKTLARLGTTCTTGSLLRARFRYGRDEQRFDANTRVVDFLFGKARIYDKHDAVDCERGLGDVGGDNDLATDRTIRTLRWRWFEDSLLKIGRKCRIQRYTLYFADVLTQILNLQKQRFKAERREKL